MKTEDIFKENYNIILKQEMIAQGTTSRALARETGYTYESIRQVFKGKDGDAGNQAIFKVCKALCVDIKEIMQEIK